MMNYTEQNMLWIEQLKAICLRDERIDESYSKTDKYEYLLIFTLASDQGRTGENVFNCCILFPRVKLILLSAI
jgi:hypothetical protein